MKEQWYTVTFSALMHTDDIRAMNKYFYETMADSMQIYNCSNLKIELEQEKTMNNRINAIANFAQRRDDEIAAKQKQAEDREEFLKQTILGWHDRIQQLIDTANACLKHGIKFWHTWANDQDYDHNYFITNGWSHLLGFELEYYNSSTITRIGKEGGGCCHFDVFTDGKTIEATGEDRLWALERFIEKFDEFETKFYAYVDKICKSK